MKTAFASFLLWISAVALLGAIALACAIMAALVFPSPAHAADVERSVCAKLELPGPAFTLNPHDPPAMQRQQVVTVCETIRFPDPRHVQHRFEPVTDYQRDPRSFA